LGAVDVLIERISRACDYLRSPFPGSYAFDSLFNQAILASLEPTPGNSL
jgi:hypothetical protein